MAGAGWRALEDALGGAGAPRIAHEDAGSPLARVTFQHVEDGRRPHWHVVTWGLSELEKKESDRPDVSGYGFELTMRVPGPAGEPPEWAARLLHRLARYVFATGNLFEPEHQMPLWEPLAPGSELTALLFAEDVGFAAPLATPFGAVRLVQVVGLTEDELALVKEWDPARYLRFLRSEDPLLATDPARPSLLADPGISGTLRRRVERDGSAIEHIAGQVVRWAPRGEKELEITLGAVLVDDVRRLLRRRLPYNRAFMVTGAHRHRGGLGFRPSDKPQVTIEDDLLVLSLPPELAADIADSLPSTRGTYAWPEVPNLFLTITPTELRGESGRLLRVVG